MRRTVKPPMLYWAGKTKKLQSDAIEPSEFFLLSRSLHPNYANQPPHESQQATHFLFLFQMR